MENCLREVFHWLKGSSSWRSTKTRWGRGAKAAAELEDDSRPELCRLWPYSRWDVRYITTGLDFLQFFTQSSTTTWKQPRPSLSWSKFLTEDKSRTQQLVARVVNLSYWIKYYSRTSPNRWFTTMSHSLNQVTRTGQQIWLTVASCSRQGWYTAHKYKERAHWLFSCPFPLIIDHFV